MFKFDRFEIINNNTFKFFYEQKINNVEYNFVETVTLPKLNTDINNNDQLYTILQNIHIMLGISYWKLFCDQEIILPYRLTKQQANFWNTVYINGLGEFFYRNNLDPRKGNIFVGFKNMETTPSDISNKNNNGALVGIGGGKDSIVTVEKLKARKIPIVGLTINTNKTSTIINNVIHIMNIKYLKVDRQLDNKLLTKSIYGAYDGHVPISAIWAWLGLLVGHLGRYTEMITSNEESANSANTVWQNIKINHQWSKSQEFENLFNKYIVDLGLNFKYYSYTRNLTEEEVVNEFVKHPQYFEVFSSCNRNFSNTKNAPSRWCGKCPKCAFVYLILASKLNKEILWKIFNKDMFADIGLLGTYKKLLGMDGLKPFECVGTIQESKKFFKLICHNKDYLQQEIPQQLCHLI